MNRSANYLRNPETPFFKRSVATALTLGFLGLSANACAEPEPQPDPKPQCTVLLKADSDCDDIIDERDRFPTIPEVSDDPDNDGIPNLLDPKPYTPLMPLYPDNTPPGDNSNSGGTGSHEITTPITTFRQPTWPDNDHDHVPDSSDADDDNDGLNDRLDPHPYTADFDNDGRIDGNDSDPYRNQDKVEEQKRQQERLDEKRRQDQLDQQRRDEERRRQQQEE